MLFEGTNDTSNVRSFLADSYINADYAQAFLVNDGIDCYCSFTSTAVADDKFTLATSDRYESVDTFNTGLQRGVNGLTVCNTVCRGFNRTIFSSCDSAFAVDGSTDSGNYTTEESFAYGNFHDAAGTAYQVAFFNSGFATHQYDTNGILVQVLNHAGYAVGQFYQFACHCIFHTDNGSDTVTDFFYDTNFFKISIHIVILEFCADSVSHSFGFVQSIVMNVDAIHNNFHFLQFAKSGSIIYFVAYLNDDTAQNGGINFFVQEDFAAQFFSENCRNGLILVYSQFFSCSNFYVQQFTNGTEVHIEVG